MSCDTVLQSTDNGFVLNNFQSAHHYICFPYIQLLSRLYAQIDFLLSKIKLCINNKPLGLGTTLLFCVCNTTAFKTTQCHTVTVVPCNASLVCFELMSEYKQNQSIAMPLTTISSTRPVLFQLEAAVWISSRHTSGTSNMQTHSCSN